MHSATANKNGQEGDVKLYGRLIAMADDRVEPYWQHVFEAMNWRPSGPAHLYTMDIESGACLRFSGEGEMQLLRWPGNGWEVRKENA